MTERSGDLLVLGIGNVLMGDEGVGVHVVRHLEKLGVPEGVELLDGGTGSFLLLEPMNRARRIILIDATLDNQSARYDTATDSHDFLPTTRAPSQPTTSGSKTCSTRSIFSDHPVDVVLFAVSIASLQEISLDLCPEIAERVPEIAQLVLHEVMSDGERRSLAEYNSRDTSSARS